MDHGTQRALIHFVLDQLAQKGADMVESDIVLDARRYYDAERLRVEEAVLFRRHPQLVAHASELPNPGDYLTQDDGGVPILVVRGEDNELRAFLNVCRHRGTRLVEGPRGQVRGAFTCPYHAWSYRVNGELLHVPHPEGFPTLDRCTSSLLPLPLQVVAGLVLVTPSSDAPPHVQSFAPIESDMKNFGLESHVVFERRQWRRKLNWKIAVDGFFENHHIRTAHRDSIYPYFLDHVGRFETIGHNLRLVAPRRSIVSLAEIPEEQWQLRQHAVLAYYLFPSTVLLVQPDHIILLMFHPQGPEETIVDQLFMVPKAPESDKARAYWQKNLDIALRVFEEDFAIGESIQRGARHNPTVRFARFERALISFHASLDQALAQSSGR